MVWSARFGGPRARRKASFIKKISEGVLPMKIKHAVTAALSLCGLGLVLGSVDVGELQGQSPEVALGQGRHVAGLRKAGRRIQPVREKVILAPSPPSRARLAGWVRCCQSWS